MENTGSDKYLNSSTNYLCHNFTTLYDSHLYGIHIQCIIYTGVYTVYGIYICKIYMFTRSRGLKLCEIVENIHKYTE